jgi:16S rRNA (guanine527-N7)-methyltransferase
MRPDIHVVLIEATRKKADFLRVTADELKLSNVTVEPRRAEEMARSIHRESFDVVVARAVALLPDFGRMAAPAGQKSADSRWP